MKTIVLRTQDIGEGSPVSVNAAHRCIRGTKRVEARPH